jgi:hypothetical protein
LIHAEDKNDLLELISEGVIDEELSLSKEYEEYTFYKINSMRYKKETKSGTVRKRYY